MNIKEVIKNLWDLIFPIECIFCDDDGEWICASCFNKLKFKNFQTCPKCGRINTNNKTCPHCSSFFYFDKLTVVGDYNDEKIKKAIKLLKYKFIKDLSEKLSDYVTLFLSEKNEKDAKKIYDQNTILIPIPIHKKRERWRGFNQSKLIGEKLADNLGVSFENKLKRIKYKKPQTKLKREERIKNIENCFRWEGGSLENKKIILLDDVITTGATLNEAARMLKESGARKIEALVVASE